MKPLIQEQQIAKLYPNADDALFARIRRAVEQVNATAEPRFLQAIFDIDEELSLAGFVPAGKDIRKHLAGARQVVVGVCTLGAGIDRLLEKEQVRDLACAYITDIAASIAVENLAERTWQEIKDRQATCGKTCTTRYSCGYGDFDLAGQKELLRISGADKAFRIQVNEGGLMYPTKSITYLVGIRD